MILPLFPLGTVLFPGGILPLKIFEARYLDMISTCLREGSGFGVNLIKSGSEVGEAADCWPVGTYARVTDWHPLPGGLLGITVQGERRYRVTRTWLEPDNLLRGEIEWLSESEDIRAAELHGNYTWLHRQLEQYGIRVEGRVSNVVWRLAEVLPLSLAARQSLLELDSMQDMLGLLGSLLQNLS